ncbi:MAG: hypothetical protein EAX96_21120 [Candidatus Lokiarchaeota archaeon]|nr:hypothetical protein [Candidatus Lokiarchaeota archaeon]
MESMSIEEIASNWLKLCKKYQFCETRMPILRKIQTKKGEQKPYSDVDFFGWKVSDNKIGYDICFGEVKVRGNQNNVNVYIDSENKNFLKWLGRWAKSFQNIKAYFLEENNGYLNERLHKYLGFYPDEVNNVNIAFVGSIWIDNIKNGELLEKIENNFAMSIYEEYKKELPVSKENITSTIRPTFYVISELVSYCKNDINNGYTKRYGDIFFDIIREINRYQNPLLLEATKNSKRIRDEIKEYTNKEIIDMFKI